MTIREQFVTAIQDRSFRTAWLVNGGAFLALLILGAVHIRPNDLQVPIRYSAFGITNIYREQWYSEFGFMGLVILVFVLGSFIGLKLFSTKNGRFATAYLWCLAVLLAITFFVLFAIFRVISVVE